LKPFRGGRSVATRDDMAFKGLADAVRQSLAYYQKLPPETRFFMELVLRDIRRSAEFLLRQKMVRRLAELTVIAEELLQTDFSSPQI
jgi:hypothetical protein